MAQLRHGVERSKANLHPGGIDRHRQWRTVSLADDRTCGQPSGVKRLDPGNLGRQQVVQRYAEKSGREVGELLFYYVYGLFKIAVIAQQIYKRFKDGFSADPRFAAMITGVRILGRTAARALDRGRIHDLG